MANNNEQKQKLLKLAGILLKETDEEHSLTMPEIVQRLEAQGVSAERKSVYRDMEALAAFGLEVERRPTSPVSYALATRPFSQREMLLLADAVQSCPAITNGMTRQLLEKLSALSSVHQEQMLEQRLEVPNRVKNLNDSVFANLDVIQEALRTRYKVEFHYFNYGVDKRPVKRKDGKLYVKNPVRLVYAQGFYYMVAYEEAHDDFTFYRVDRMCDVRVSGERRARNPRIANYSKMDCESLSFGMFSGERCMVSLRVTEKAMNSVIDKFGSRVRSLAEPDGTALVEASVVLNPPFYAWVAEFGSQMRILGPSKAVEGMRAFLTESLSVYEGTAAGGHVDEDAEMEGGLA